MISWQRTVGIGGALAVLLLSPSTHATHTSPSLPSSGVYATFSAGNEVFHTSITNTAAINDAIALWRGQSTKRIPVGRLSCTAAGWNAPWHWHQVPSSVTFANYAVEVCDGLPSHVERGCLGFGMGYYCPWNAQMLQLRDCRRDRRCPLVPR